MEDSPSNALFSWFSVETVSKLVTNYLTSDISQPGYPIKVNELEMEIRLVISFMELDMHLQVQ